MAKPSKKELTSILSFLHEAEKLKSVLRHSWLSSGRRESTAEHTWRMALMAILLHPHLKKKPDLFKTLKMVLVHDLAEVYAGDYASWKKEWSQKYQTEQKAITRIVKPLEKAMQKELVDLWEEYAENKTKEANFAKALDKLEVMIQHHEAGTKKNNKHEFKFNLNYGITYCAHDYFLKCFRDLLNKEFLKQYKKDKINPKLYQN